ncbi:MAG: hypothetical protein A3G27_00840 [Betaproteobacteria bacterium RIFCSPLOWO2_12_FULL_66_14]|nr:MAG: hypothetical protein A3G27_00840 [Betaproteobacteria bacterium RIFCSPLOWO2_12_FULL_66_14]
MKSSKARGIGIALLALSAGVAFTGVEFAGASQAIVQTARGASKALPTQTNKDGGVSVSVTPRPLAPGASAWEFEVALTTHSGDLGEDLAKVAYLVEPSGQKHAPLAWQGSAPGGHHRKGLLQFKPLAAQPDSLELHIEQVGGIATRTFRWEIK